MPRSRRRGRWQVARNGDQVRHPERPGSARGRRSPGGVNGPFPRRRRPPRPDLPPRGAADQVFTQFVFPPPARAAGARGRPHTCPPGPRSRSTGVAAPSAPSRCGKRGQQVRRWLERHGRRAVPPPPSATEIWRPRHAALDPGLPACAPRSSRPPGRTADEGRASATRGSFTT